MEITEIRIFPKEGQDKKLKAYATVTFDNCFVVRNVKVIQGSSGLFVAMPSRKMRVSCQKCHFKNEVGSRYCNQCGSALHVEKQEGFRDSKAEHRDIAHPVTQEFRDRLQKSILEVYEKEASSVQARAGSSDDLLED